MLGRAVERVPSAACTTHYQSLEVTQARRTDARVCVRIPWCLLLSRLIDDGHPLWFGSRACVHACVEHSCALRDAAAEDKHWKCISDCGAHSDTRWTCVR